MIVIYRNGVPTVITGWRSWLIVLAGALVFVVIGGLMLERALTVWTVNAVLHPDRRRVRAGCDVADAQALTTSLLHALMGFKLGA